MSNLPAWILRQPRRPTTRELELVKALAIAWEALMQTHNNLIESGLDENDFGPTLRIIKDALRRIEEMGK